MKRMGMAANAGNRDARAWLLDRAERDNAYQGEIRTAGSLGESIF
ncbi:MAG TPA: hypothetical protein VGI20_09645 [Rhizomicrobium sp.]